jgi:hypothetical protein
MKIAHSLDAFGIRVGSDPAGKGAWSLQLILPPTAELALEATASSSLAGQTLQSRCKSSVLPIKARMAFG